MFFSVPVSIMTQQEQQDFMEKLETAISWMRAIQERLKSNDNTQGPRHALEARLRDTEVRPFSCCLSNFNAIVSTMLVWITHVMCALF